MVIIGVYRFVLLRRCGKGWSFLAFDPRTNGRAFLFHEILGCLLTSLFLCSSEALTSPLSKVETSKRVGSAMVNCCSDVLVGLSIILTETAQVLKRHFFLLVLAGEIWTLNLFNLLRLGRRLQLIEFAEERVHCADMAYLRGRYFLWIEAGRQGHVR